ncbi:MAG: hypothetical protein ACM30G_05250 [Micromonosporaceae bacterium]
MKDIPGSYRFVAWSRRGLAAAIPSGGPGLAGPAGALTAPPSDGRVRLPVTLTVRKGASATEGVTRTLALYGPGDVVRLDTRQIIRREPRPGTTDFEPNYFPLVEFDSPELPWLLSPEPSGSRIRPWLALVVVRRELGQIQVDPRRPLPWLSITTTDAQHELPDLTESWAWAHLQIAGSSAAPADALDGRNPELTLARLLCPRRLQPQQAYLACLVPVYWAGVQAGLGQPVEAGLELAWPPPKGWPTNENVELPVYDHWEFATGDAGDFELLVRRLRPHAVGPDVGALPVDISAASPDFADLHLPSPTLLGFEGALTSPQLPERKWPPDVQAPFARRLEELIEVPPGVDVTVLRPPIYGGHQAGADQLPDSGRGWLRELNLDPGWRAAAALGVRVVQQNQEQLMAAAWDQAGDLAYANRLLRQAQLARATAGGTRDKHLDGLSVDSAVRLTEPVHGRVRVSSDGGRPGPGVRSTLRASVKESVFPQAALSPPFRRALRPTGPLGRRLPGEPQAATAGLSAGLAGGRLRVPVRPARGGADFDEVGAQARPPGQERPRFQHLRDNVGQGAGWRLVAATDPSQGGFYVGDDPYGSSAPAQEPGTESTTPAAETTMVAAGPMLPGDGWDIEERGRRADRLRGINNRFKRATEFLLQHLPATLDGPPPAGPTLGLSAVADALVGRGGALEPDDTVAGEVITLVPAAPADKAADPLRPRAAAPHFDQPMSVSLLSVDDQMLLPGIERLSADSVGVLVSNSRFLEAFLAGVNHELSREFLWRGLPADLGATFADRFWDVRGRHEAAGEPDPQVPPIADWQGALGQHVTAAGGTGLLVLIIRGRLLYRYPHTAVYAVKAVPKVDPAGQPVLGPGKLPIPVPGPQERYPQFRGTIRPDVTYLGFDLTAAEARGDGTDLGWFFVIQEQPTAARFGVDEPGAGKPAPPVSWSELDWADLAPPDLDLSTMEYASIAGPLATPPLTLPVLAGRPQPTATWGADAAQMAAITYQRPMRVALHARTTLPPDTP